MYDVMTIGKAKDAFLQIRIREDIKQELAILAEIRGLSMSALINTWAVKAIREEKNHSPELFHQNGQIVARITSDKAEEARIRRELSEPLPAGKIRVSREKRKTGT